MAHEFLRWQTQSTVSWDILLSLLQQLQTTAEANRKAERGPTLLSPCSNLGARRITRG